MRRSQTTTSCGCVASVVSAVSPLATKRIAHWCRYGLSASRRPSSRNSSSSTNRIRLTPATGAARPSATISLSGAFEGGLEHSDRFPDDVAAEVGEPLDEPFGDALPAGQQQVVGGAAGVIGQHHPDPQLG